MKFFLFFLLSCFLLGFVKPKLPVRQLALVVAGFCCFVAFGYFYLRML